MTKTHGEALAALTHCRAALTSAQRALRRAGFREDQVSGDIGALIDLLVARANIDVKHLEGKVEDLRDACRRCGYRETSRLLGE